jgi:hypothetical protein
MQLKAYQRLNGGTWRRGDSVGGVSDSSRDSAAGAGWREPGEPVQRGLWTSLLGKRLHPPSRPFRWISADALLKSYNDVLTKFAGERIVYEQRQRWVRRLREAGRTEGFDGLVVDRLDLAEPRFLLVGDPGEGDASQYCVATAIRSVPGTDFMVVCSDVIYPAGDVNDYADKFYVPYADYPGQVYALPGNHDWYDLLHGFVYAFCDVTMPFSVPRPSGLRERVAGLLWRTARPIDGQLLDPLRAQSPPWRPGEVPIQPGPYFAIDAGPLRLVCIDTGINGSLDAEQGRWLAGVSAGPRPKVLLTGKPLIVDYRRRPCPIDGSSLTVDDIVRTAGHNYVATIGGDIHNYQRYPVEVDGRVIQYVVAGGGGAFMHATHGLPPGTVPAGLPAGVRFPAEDQVRLYPLRGDSLAFYARQAVPYLRRVVVGGLVATGLLLAVAGVLAVAGSPLAAAVLVAVAALVVAYLGYMGALGVLLVRGSLRDGRVDPNVASAFLAQRYGLAPTRSQATRVTVSPAERRVLELVLPLKKRGLLVKFLSEILDSDDPPFFKHFLLLQVRDGRLVVQCRAVTGWAGAERDPPVEDCFEIELDVPGPQPGSA